MSRVLVYHDDGVAGRSLRLLLRSLKQEGVEEIQRVDRHTMIPALAHSSLLIFPGGRDIPYHQALSGEPNRSIRSWVEEGGCYLGICAGGYYGCRTIQFSIGTPLEVEAERELSFFSGRAVGPAYAAADFSYRSERGARAARIRHAHGVEMAVYFNGGCYFSPSDSEGEVLARYADLPGKPAAIVLQRVGQGKAILSGVHPEFSARDLPAQDPYLKQWIPQLLETEQERRELFRSLLQECLTKSDRGLWTVS